MENPVKDYAVSGDTKASELVKHFSSAGGFTASKLAEAADILEEMLKRQGSTNFLSFPACIVSTGLRGVLADLVKRKLFNVVVTTCGTLDHDIARSFKEYYAGSFSMDDGELHKKGINRLGNVLVPNESYGVIIEEKMQEWLEELHAGGVKETSGHELCWFLGSKLKEDSILYWANENKIPVIVPALVDGAVGTQTFLYTQEHDFTVDQFADQKLLAELTFGDRETGALIVGGGVSKHHTIWWNQYCGGLSRAVYLTSAPEWDGSLSGARMREAVSWGKMKEKSRYVTVEGDATINLPLIAAALLDRI